MPEIPPQSVRVQYYEQGTTDLIHDHYGDDRRRHITSGVHLCSCRLHVNFKPLISDNNAWNDAHCHIYVNACVV